MTKYGVSLAWIYRIIAATKAEDLARRQRAINLKTLNDWQGWKVKRWLLVGGPWHGKTVMVTGRDFVLSDEAGVQHVYRPLNFSVHERTYQLGVNGAIPNVRDIEKLIDACTERPD